MLKPPANIPASGFLFFPKFFGKGARGKPFCLKKVPLALSSKNSSNLYFILSIAA